MTTPSKIGTQKQKILHYLQQHPNQRIPCYKFSLDIKIMRYGARLWQLEKEGFPIENERKGINGKKHSSRRLTTAVLPKLNILDRLKLKFPNLPTTFKV